MKFSVEELCLVESSFDQIRRVQNSNNRSPPETFPLIIIILDPHFNKNGTDEAEAESGKVRLPTSPTPPPSISSKHWWSSHCHYFHFFWAKAAHLKICPGIVWINLGKKCSDEWNCPRGFFLVQVNLVFVQRLNDITCLKYPASMNFKNQKQTTI